MKGRSPHLRSRQANARTPANIISEAHRPMDGPSVTGPGCSQVKSVTTCVAGSCESYALLWVVSAARTLNAGCLFAAAQNQRGKPRIVNRREHVRSNYSVLLSMQPCVIDGLQRFHHPRVSSELLPGLVLDLRPFLSSACAMLPGNVLAPRLANIRVFIQVKIVSTMRQTFRSLRTCGHGQYPAHRIRPTGEGT